MMNTALHVFAFIGYASVVYGCARVYLYCAETHRRYRAWLAEMEAEQAGHVLTVTRPTATAVTDHAVYTLDLN